MLAFTFYRRENLKTEKLIHLFISKHQLAIYHVPGTRLALGTQDEKDKILTLKSSQMGEKHYMALFVGACSEWEVTCPT